MKKTYLLLAALFIGGASFAQMNLKARGIIKKKTYPNSAFVHHNAPLLTPTPTDTLGLMQFAATSGQPALYGNTGGGYIFGTSVYQPGQGLAYESAQGYLVSQPYNIIGAMIWFGAKQFAGSDSVNHAGMMVVNAYTMSPNKAIYNISTATSGDYIGPDQVIDTANLSLTNADTTNYTFVNFPHTAWVQSDFALSVNVQDLYTKGDTVGIVSDSPGDGMDYAFTKAFNGKWYVTDSLYGGGLNVNVGIFAIVAQSAAGINSNYYIDGMRLGVCQPNPAVGNTTIQYDLQNNAKNVELDVFNTTGQLVKVVKQGAQKAGKHNLKLNVQELAAGTYYYSLKTGSKRLTKKMVVVK